MGIFLGTGSNSLYPLFEFEVDGKKSEITPDNEEEKEEEDKKEEEKDEQEQQDEGEENEPEAQSSGTDGPDRGDVTSDDEYNVGGADGGEEGQEADAGGGETDQTDADGPDRGDVTSDDEYTLGDGEEDGNGEEGTDDGGPQSGEGETSDDEYNINSDGGESDQGGSEEGDNSGESDEGDSSSSDDSSSEEGPEDKLKQLEAELFDSLSDEQKAIKIDELKNCYHQLYSRCDSLIGMINDSTAPDENSSRVLEYVNDNLSDLKQYIYDYFTNTFDTKSYMENDAQYQKYIAILNSFNTILEELKKVRDKDNS